MVFINVFLPAAVNVVDIKLYILWTSKRLIIAVQMSLDDYLE